MDKLDKQILVVRIGVNQAIRNLKRDPSKFWKIKNYNLLKNKLQELEFQRGIDEFDRELNRGRNS